MELKTSQIKRFGVRLDEAWLHFGFEELRELFNAPAPQLPIAAAPAKPSWDALGRLLLTAISLPADRQFHATKAAEAKQAMQRHLVTWLGADEMVAFGRQLHPSNVRALRRIPRDFWPYAQITWHSDTAANPSRSFYGIVVVDPQLFPGLDDPPRIGGKTYGEEIVWALDQLLIEMPELETRTTHKEKAGLIREKLLGRYPELDVYGRYFHPDTIRGHVKTYFQNRKAIT